MILFFVKRYWRLILAIASFSILIGSMYFLYERNIYLEKKVHITEKERETALEAVESLKRQKEISDITLKENTLKQAEIKRKLEENRDELNRLKQESIRNKEKGSECLLVDVPRSINNRLRNKSTEGGSN